MTEEQIRPIAENYVEEFCLDPDDEYTSGSLVCAGIGTALIVARTLEKQNEELKTRNAELKGKYAYAAREAETYKQFCEQKEKRIAELQEENEQLNRQYKFLSNQICNKECAEVWSENSKAKEIICLGLRAVETDGKCNKLFVEQAEAFLKECGE